MSIFDSLISAGGSLLSGILGQGSQSKAIAAQQAMNDQNIALQREFAQNGLQWKEADARAGEAKYGINPLVAMGAPTASFSNVTGSFPAESPMGQGLERAAQAFAGANTRSEMLKDKLLEAQIANVNSDTVKNQAAASKVATVVPASPPPLWTDYKDADGKLVRLPSKDASSSMQNWASMPAQIGIAVSQAGNAIESEYHKLLDPIYEFVRAHGAVPVRGDAYRGARDWRYDVPF